MVMVHFRVWIAYLASLCIAAVELLGQVLARLAFEDFH